MANISVEQFLEYVAKSELVDDDALQKSLEDLRQKNGGALPQNADAVADHLEAQKLVTRWHLVKLLDKKYKGFFLGKYKLLGHLGTGGMSSVYLAEHMLMHRLQAVKVLPKARVNDTSYLDRFIREAQATASLNHPNIVRAYDVDSDGPNHFIVMEYVCGKDLQSIVKESGPLPYELACNYLAQAAEGFQYAHEQKLIHRDVKPANLLVDDAGTVKILDLGLALMKDDERASLTIAHNENVLGTADYLAPEQAVNSHNVDLRADIYSLGCTLYFALTGHPPFPDGSLAQRIAKHQTHLPEDIRKDRPDCPRDLVDICVKMMQKRPERRYASMRQVADALEQWLASRNVAFDTPLSISMASRSGGGAIAVPQANRTPAVEQRGRGSSVRKAAVARPTSTPRTDETASNQIQIDTVKGLKAKAPSEKPSIGPPRTGSDKITVGPPKPSGKPVIPTARPVPGTAAGRLKREENSDFNFTLEPTASSSGKSSGKGNRSGKLTTSAAVPTTAAASEAAAKPKQPLPLLWIGVAAGAVLIAIIAVVALMFGGGSKPPKPKPAPGHQPPGMRDTSELPRPNFRLERWA